ncbi:hypothetical protein CHH69_18820, partial [Terribacillus saccharophilus]|uniref:hypothetical protein n=1 Tax=Terribacillus saccharophilus TaxID=361277 RepID=UPI000BD8D716
DKESIKKEVWQDIKYCWDQKDNTDYLSALQETKEYYEAQQSLQNNGLSQSAISLLLAIAISIINGTLY